MQASIGSRNYLFNFLHTGHIQMVSRRSPDSGEVDKAISEKLAFGKFEVDTNRIVHIHSVIILRRSDKRKDRVEISPEQLSSAATEAERLAEMTGRPMRVVGWYHSHPHITVWPSHVDVRTQAMYQMMDQGFVGLIFSCFIEDKNTKTGRVLYTCFQSVQAQKGSEYERIEIPIHVIPHEAIGKVCLESAVELPRILCQEEQDTYRKIHRCGELWPDQYGCDHLKSQNLCSTPYTIALWATIITPFFNWSFSTVPFPLN
ncbi:lys-63-specific deubiquitinase BRCC36-like isoform X3 [Salvelinus namaycush]|uniref:Lys-63-specific deubiquitinase BRCC36-like isoform X3 n=1 Tax=Salvelinus namaycush TaxID=8040 RepID=A0A8U1BPB2_SALNM|nr:lys-63-specific deubiquitinase BRCC36-like isoform X3 [Salvelinus namaycush]